MKRFVALLLTVTVTVGCGGGVTWSRSVVINRTSHVALALDTETASACYRSCLASTPPAACLERCEGATVIPGPCADADRSPQRACFARGVSNSQSLPGRCRDSIELAPGESVVGCAESSTPKPARFVGVQLVIGAVVLVGLVFAGVYLAVRPPDGGQSNSASAMDAFDARPNRR